MVVRCALLRSESRACELVITMTIVFHACDSVGHVGAPPPESNPDPKDSRDCPRAGTSDWRQCPVGNDSTSRKLRFEGCERLTLTMMMMMMFVL